LREEREAEKLDQEPGRAEQKALAQTREQQQGRQQEQPTGDHQEAADQSHKNRG
jgi:hypothetical protein